MFFSLLFFLSCESSDKKTDVIEGDQNDEYPYVSQPNSSGDSQNVYNQDDLVPNLALTWDANIYFVNFSTSDEEKVLTAVELMKRVIASEEFKNAVINHTYNGQKTFVDNDGYSNSEIYQIILEGAEIIGNRTKNNTLDVELELYYALTNTVGYTYSNTTRIWMNTKYFNTFSPSSVAGNLMHEWLHKLGFGHASTWSESRDYSVPYAIGRIMSSMAANL